MIEYWTAASNIWFRLVDGADGTVVWSRNFERVAALSDADADDDRDHARQLAAAGLRRHPVARPRQASCVAAGDPRYRCLLEATAAIVTADRAEHERARDCLERLTAIDPGFAVGLHVPGADLQPRIPTRVRDPAGRSARARPLAAQRRGNRLRCVPKARAAISRCWWCCSIAATLQGAFAAAEKSIALNRYDMLALGEYGGRLILTGEVERGMTMMRRADAFGAVRPSWQLIYLFVGNYLTGDLAEAARFANQIPANNFALGQVARALAAAGGGEAADARQAIDRLVQMQPSWRDDPRAELARIIPDPKIVDRLPADLRAAGLGQTP